MRQSSPPHLMFFFALLFAISPVFAEDDKEAEPLPEEDTILGTWYMQVIEGEIVPADEMMRLVFEDNGTVRAFEGNDEEETGTYTHDEKQSQITIFDQDKPDRIEAIIKYSFIDDMLVMAIRQGRGGDGEEERFEFTRKSEGTKRHQALREKQGGQPTHKKRLVQMRQLYLAAMTYQADQNDMPASLGDMVVGDYITPRGAVPKPAYDKLPKDFADWKKQAKADWINQHADCVYIKVDLNDPQIDASKMIALFQVPANKQQEELSMVFADGHAEVLPYKDADREISKQTGHALEQWMKTTSPGSGQMVLPEKKDEDKEQAPTK